ncbi:MAG: molybdopterin-binding protein, partial [Chloroflexota bacterium]
YRKTTVGDNSQRIAQAIQQALERCDIIITTGGLGPTVDDPTREAVALAMGTQTEFRPELWEQILARFQRFNRAPTENNKRQAYIPAGAIAVENPVGTAPSFIYEKDDKSIISLPGVPREMEFLWLNAIQPYLRKRYALTGIIKALVLHTVGVGESMIDDLIGDLETLRNPTVGLAAHSGQVDVRITAKADSDEKADEMIHPVELQLRKLLGLWIYGSDEETLEEIALKAVRKRGWNVAAVEYGAEGLLVNRLSSTALKMENSLGGLFRGGEAITSLASPADLAQVTAAYRQTRQADACLGIAVFPRSESAEVYLTLITPDGQQELTRPYGGPPENAPRWAVNHGLDLLRKL